MTVSFQDTDLATAPKTLVVGSDTISGVDYQRIKIAQGDTGTATDISSGNPLWTTFTSTSLSVSLNSTTVSLSSTTVTISSTIVSLSSTTVSLSATSSTLVIGAVLQGTSPWVTSPSSQWTVTTTPSSQIAVNAVLSNPLGWLSSSTSTSISVPPIIGSVAPSSQWTVTTTPSTTLAVINTSSTATIGTVLQGTSPWVTSISSSTAQIGSVAASSQWTVSVTPTSAISVTPSSQWTVSVTPTSAISVTPSSQWTVTGALTFWSGSTSTSSGIPLIGSVSPSSQWTVTTTPSSQQTVTIQASTAIPTATSSSSAVIGSIILTSGTQVIGSVAASSQWTVTTIPSSQITVTTVPTSSSLVIGSVVNTSSTAVIGTVNLTSGTQVIGSVAPSSQWTVTAVTTAVQAFAADVATLMSSGTVVAPLYHIVVAAATGLTILSSAVASKSQVLLAASITNGSSTVNATFSLRSGTTSTTLYGVTALPAGAVAAINLPYCPVGWITTPSSEGISINVASTGTPVIGGAITFAAF